jgi:hypothetical protein
VLLDFLHANIDIFVWSPSDMLGIPREVAEHALEIRVGSKPVKQRLRRFDEEKRKVIGEEIHKLLEAGFIKEVHHPEWLANPVLVKKKNGKWRMFIDYTSLNKACPKFPFPLPRIDQIDDIVVKTKKASDLVNDLDVAFKCLWTKNIMLNPEKCVFSVPRGMLLGFIISKRGIKANPEKSPP